MTARILLLLAVCLAACLAGCSGGTDGSKGSTGSTSGSAAPVAVTSLALLAGNASGAGSADGTGTAAAFNHPAGLAADTSGNVFVADAGNDTIRKIAPDGTVSTFAGNATASGSDDGTGTAARFNLTLSVNGFVAPAGGLAADGSGNLYVADTGNHAIRKITPGAVVTTLAGQSGQKGGTDGQGSAARFTLPMALTADATGVVYVADTGSHAIRRIAADGTVTTLAGLAGTRGSVNGTGSAARFFLPSGIARDSAGNLFVSDAGNHLIRKVTSTGVVTTFAGQAGTPGAADGTGAAATFRNPGGIAIDGSDNLYVADSGHTVRRITPAGVVTTLAGNAAEGSGTFDGTGAGARFNGPYAVASDAAGTVYVADQDNHTIRKIDAAGVVTTLAGQAGAAGSNDGFATGAAMRAVQAVAVDGAGNAYLADAGNNTIRKVSAIGEVITLAGNAGAAAGSADGTGTAATFNLPTGLVADPLGNVYVADTGNHTIRRITAAGVVTTIAGSAGVAGSDDGTGTAARFNKPMGLVLDKAGNLFVCDSGNHTIRVITPAGVVTTFAGSAGSAGSTDGIGSQARFDSPAGLAISTVGNLYVADFRNRIIRRITPSGAVALVAGSPGQSGSTDGIGTAARFVLPWGIAADSAGNLYVADPYNNAVRKIGPNADVTTLAGKPGTGRFAEGTLPGQLTFPTGVAFSGTSLFISLPTGIAVVRNLVF